MTKILTAMATAICAIVVSTSSGNAAGLDSLGNLTAQPAGKSEIIKVHSRRRSHNSLHNYGYNGVSYLKQRRDYDGRPIRTYRAYRGRREYHVSIDWYGDIVDRHLAEQCY